jgi:cell division protein ZapA
MAEKLKIKISIADRVYPLTVETTQEEGLRTASKKIDATIKKFEASYAVRDKQDVLAMCALQFASQIEQTQIDTSTETVDAFERLKRLDEKIEGLLSK